MRTASEILNLIDERVAKFVETNNRCPNCVILDHYSYQIMRGEMQIRKEFGEFRPAEDTYQITYGMSLVGCYAFSVPFAKMMIMPCFVDQECIEEYNRNMKDMMMKSVKNIAKELNIKEVTLKTDDLPDKE